ncbi:hypothetical protein BHF71_05015 [Vulcanibacillus modesticaldus]|uniref:DUF3866 domain-containing protein n=1 Tax=Vulcanibacillus modesticaldus TaxID=337097 RepID=A0A1D2YRW1_9BACI|nr:DUF3866 family protein [Vulcanibacillus modesticaldus]OEF95552.1 hypothetical protein BHF71_05015 [Vulcanibacillus modesticaldus]
MVRWGIGKVIEISKETKNIQVVIVEHQLEISQAINYLQFHKPLVLGDLVIINKTASILNLGTGGYDFVVSPINLNAKESCSDEFKEKGHIMKLRYTPYQFSVKSCEEQGSPYHELFKKVKNLNGLPVIIGELHSMLPIVITIFRQLENKYNVKEKKIVYIMTDGGSLPIALSRHVETLTELGWLTNTITIGHAFGGDIEAVNIFTGLIAAKYIFQADLVIVLMGPGIVGTGTLLGHSGVEQGIIANAVGSLKGLPIFIVRASQKDHRQRHLGISHHTISNLNYISLVKNIVPYPDYIKDQNQHQHLYKVLEENIGSKHQLTSVKIDHQEVLEFVKKYPANITTMGRTIEQDPVFFDFVACVAYWAFDHINNL